MSMPRLFFIFVLTAGVLPGCAMWERVGDRPLVGPDKHFSVSVPKGWMHYKIDSKAVTVTRDGLPLQMIRVGFWPHSKSFKVLNKRSSADMLPSELAELVVAVIRKSYATKNARIIENKPVRIAGYHGFAVKIRFKNARGLRYKRDIYGFATKEGIYFLMYQAPELYYYPRTRSVFASAVDSLKVMDRNKNKKDEKKEEK